VVSVDVEMEVFMEKVDVNITPVFQVSIYDPSIVL
jgi:hypothetical protein